MYYFYFVTSLIDWVASLLGMIIDNDNLTLNLNPCSLKLFISDLVLFEWWKPAYIDNDWMNSKLVFLLHSNSFSTFQESRISWDTQASLTRVGCHSPATLQSGRLSWDFALQSPTYARSWTSFPLVCIVLGSSDDCSVYCGYQFLSLRCCLLPPVRSQSVINWNWWLSSVTLGWTATPLPVLNLQAKILSLLCHFHIAIWQ